MRRKAKPRKKPIKSGVTRGAGLYADLSRVEWGERALKSRANAIDHGKMAKNQNDATPGNYNAWLKGGHKKYDLAGYDHPRDDIKKVPKTYYKYAGSPKVRLPKTVKTAERVLKNNFTARERRQIGKVVIDGVRPKNKKWAGCNSYFHDIKLNLIRIAPSRVDSEDVYTHELIHARRHGGGEYIRDRNIDEKQTDFETVGRLSSPDKKDTGYYYYIKDGDFKDNVNYDRRLLTGKTGKKRKGKWYMADVKKQYDKSKIKTAHFSPAEDLDRYFQVILPRGGGKVSVHRRYKHNLKDTKAQIFKEFKKEFGTDIKAYEWENGKRVRMGRAVKPKIKTRRVKTRAIRTKKPSVKRTPKRAPVKRKVALRKKPPVKRTKRKPPAKRKPLNTKRKR